MYNVVAEFVTWLFDLAVSCFFPGASYQRQKTGEDIPQCSYLFVAKSSNFVNGLRIMFKMFYSNAAFSGHLGCVFSKMAARQEEGSATRCVCYTCLVCVCTNMHGTTEFLCLLSCLQLK